jgi:hypothetical protein
MAVSHKDLWSSVSELTEWSGRERLLLQAFCIIIAKAVSPPKPRKRAKKAESPKLAFSPQELHQALLNDCPAVNVSTYDKTSFGKLGKILQRVNDLTRQDLDSLVGWLNDGGVEWWNRKPVWDNVIDNIVKWIATAREWAEDNVGYDGETSIR